MILPPATLGMLGGGQLGRFFVAAAHEMGYKVWCWTRTPQPCQPHRRPPPAGRLRRLRSPRRPGRRLCSGHHRVRERPGHHPGLPLAKFIPVRPGASAVAVCQNRIAENPSCATTVSPRPLRRHPLDADIAAADASLYPAILKVARFGYDGKGQARVANAAEALHAFRQFRVSPACWSRC